MLRNIGFHGGRPTMLGVTMEFRGKDKGIKIKIDGNSNWTFRGGDRRTLSLNKRNARNTRNWEEDHSQLGVKTGKKIVFQKYNKTLKWILYFGKTMTINNVPTNKFLVYKNKKAVRERRGVKSVADGEGIMFVLHRAPTKNKTAFVEKYVGQFQRGVLVKGTVEALDVNGAKIDTATLAKHYGYKPSPKLLKFYKNA